MATRPLRTRRGLRAALLVEDGDGRAALLLGLAAGRVGGLPLGAQRGAAAQTGPVPGPRTADGATVAGVAHSSSTRSAGTAPCGGAGRRTARGSRSCRGRRRRRSRDRSAARRPSARRRSARRHRRGGLGPVAVGRGGRAGGGGLARHPRGRAGGPESGGAGGGECGLAPRARCCGGAPAPDAAVRGRLRRSSGGATGAEASCAAIGERPHVVHGRPVGAGLRRGDGLEGRGGGARRGRAAAAGGRARGGRATEAGTGGRGSRERDSWRAPSGRGRGPGGGRSSSAVGPLAARAVGWSLSSAAGPRHSASGTSVRRRPAATGAFPRSRPSLPDSACLPTVSKSNRCNSHCTGP